MGIGKREETLYNVAVTKGFIHIGLIKDPTYQFRSYFSGSVMLPLPESLDISLDEAARRYSRGNVIQKALEQYFYKERSKVFQRFFFGSGDLEPFRDELIPDDRTQEDEKSHCKIKGKIAPQGRKFYVIPGHSLYSVYKVDTSKGERWFCSEEEAEAVGWEREVE